jgi:hypothetical protein
VSIANFFGVLTSKNIVTNFSFLKDIFADFRRAGKYPPMTASFCFRAIEIIRKFGFEDQTILNEIDREKAGWKKTGELLGFKKSDSEEIRSFALPNRHGIYPTITYLQRERIMNFTRNVIDKFIERLSLVG